MATCVVSGTLLDPSETAISGATVSFKIDNAYANSSSTNFFAPKTVSTTTASDGTWSLTLSRGISGVIQIDYTADSYSPARRLSFSVVVPAAATSSFNTLVTEVI